MPHLPKHVDALLFLYLSAASNGAFVETLAQGWPQWPLANLAVLRTVERALL